MGKKLKKKNPQTLYFYLLFIMTKRLQLEPEKTMNIIDNSNNKMEHVDILLDLIKSSEKKEVSDFSKSLINLLTNFKLFIILLKMSFKSPKVLF